MAKKKVIKKASKFVGPEMAAFGVISGVAHHFAKGKAVKDEGRDPYIAQSFDQEKDAIQSYSSDKSDNILGDSDAEAARLAKKSYQDEIDNSDASRGQKRRASRKADKTINEEIN